MVGLALARAGAHVWLTDGSQQVLSLLQQNVDANATMLPHRPCVRLLRWGDQSDLDELTVELGHSKDAGTERGGTPNPLVSERSWSVIETAVSLVITHTVCVRWLLGGPLTHGIWGHGSAGMVNLVVLSECVYGDSAGES